MRRGLQALLAALALLPAVGCGQVPPTAELESAEGAAPAAGAAVLYRQDPGASPLAMRFQDGPGALADDFAVPAGTSWRVDEVELVGDLHEPSLSLRFYRDRDGAPGPLVHAFSAPPYAVTAVSDEERVYRVRLPAVLTLPAGRYWLGVYGARGEAFDWREFPYASGQPLHFTSDEARWSNMGDYGEHGCCDLAFAILGRAGSAE